MSQPNESYTPFRYPEQQAGGAGYYGPENPPPAFTNPNTNPPFSPWEHPGPRPMGYSTSPSPTVRTSKSAPNPRPSIDIMDFNRSSVPQQTRRGLSIDHSVNPLLQFWEGKDEPWSSQRLRTAYPSQPSEFGTFDPPSSDNEAIAHRSDSGYATTLPPRSIVSHTGSTDPELPHEVYRIGHMGVRSVHSDPRVATSNTESVYSDPSNRSGSRSVRHGSSNRREYRCPECNEVSRCRSDYKKHVNRHSKPNLCLIPGCRRGGLGFTTSNDLDRHKKSVHGIGKTKNSYRCEGSEACRTKGKIWPRLDNFKQHIHRMHKDEDEQDLINRSRINNVPEEPEPSMDTTLAGIGTDERQFSTSSNELDDPMGGISLTPDQESNRWSSFVPSTHNFSMDVDQTSPLTSVPGSNLHGHGYDHDKPTSISSDISTETLPRQPSYEKLDALAEVATSQVPENPAPQASQLSSAPQTKADQQREAFLVKFGKMVVNAARNSSGEDVEDLLQRLASQTIIQTPRISHKQSASQETTQSSRASQTKSPTPPYPHRRRTSSLSAGDGKQCEQCSLIVRRACDMRKHLKRHTRPYGCTYPNCDKRFGAKSDWKRHENSQHFQLESYRCQLPATPASSTSTSPSTSVSVADDPIHNVCGEFFTRPKHFESHLIHEHSLTDRHAVEAQIKACRIGKNGQGQFWCGFCVKVIKLEKKRNAAWDERFDHIDRHFCKEGRGIEEWVCVEGGRRKGDVATARMSERVDKTEEVEEQEGDQQMEGVPVDEPRVLLGGYIELPPSPQLSPHSQSPSGGIAGSSSEGSRKRRSQEEVPETESPRAVKRSMHGHHYHSSRREHANMYCCTCDSGPWATHTFPSCVECNHQWCSRCMTYPFREE